MSLSPNSFEVISELLAQRLESFLLTNNGDTRELHEIAMCQQELIRLRVAREQMMQEEQHLAQSLLTPAVADAEFKAPQPAKLSRRFQRFLHDPAEDGDNIWHAQAG